MEHYFQQPVIRHESDRWRSENNSAVGFECSICLDIVEEPVVTFCGHLYCWPCIYMWIHSHKENQPQCPVCNAEVTEDTVIPLYGRGKNGNSLNAKGSEFRPTMVPQRPNAPRCGFHTLVATPSNSHLHSPAFGFAGTTTFQPMIGMFFGNSETTLYAYPNTYSVVSTGSARARRRVMEVNKSLSRVSFFLCCCLVLCLLLF